jgi:hypothetical protein
VLSRTHERMIEWTIESGTPYNDPFNDVEIDVTFSKDGQNWRVPTFWRGGRQWTVRFAPPVPGEYSYRVHCNDSANHEFDESEGRVRTHSYKGGNDLLRRGPLRVARNGRHFEHADGTPFYWLGDTWWTGLSDRLSWAGFQALCADRKAKGFTVVQVVAGLVPPEELAPLDSGFRNEGGAVWEGEFRRINPKYFEYADRRIFHLIDNGIVPAIVGAWNSLMPEIGAAKLRQHWRYIVARYGAYPVLWIVGGEVVDPPADGNHCCPVPAHSGSWTATAKYLRDVDPYRHPLTVHELPPPLDVPLQDESLTDFDLFQSSHFGWPSAALSVAQISHHYARTSVTRPVVQGEIGYEKIFATHFEDFQRYSFWTSMLNGAAGHTYGADGVIESYTSDKPLHRLRWSFLSWEEGMKLPGSYQVGLGAKLLRRFQWWRFEPHPEWVSPRGPTFFESRHERSRSDFGLCELYQRRQSASGGGHITQMYAEGLGREWCGRQGDFRAPYAAGIAGEVRIIYIPSIGFSLPRIPPTVLRLEQGIRYRAYLWEPSIGMHVDLGSVERAQPGPVMFSGQLSEVGVSAAAWFVEKQALIVLREVSASNVTARLTLPRDRPIGVLLRYRDPDNYIAAMYSPGDECIYIVDRRRGTDGRMLGRTPVEGLGATVSLTAEVRGSGAIASISDGVHTCTTPIVDVRNVEAGSAGLLLRSREELLAIGELELHCGSEIAREDSLNRMLYDAEGAYRGELVGQASRIQEALAMPCWDDFGRHKHILLDAYRPDIFPAGDWVLVLETEAALRCEAATSAASQ